MKADVLPLLTLVYKNQLMIPMEVNLQFKTKWHRSKVKGQQDVMIGGFFSISADFSEVEPFLLRCRSDLLRNSIRQMCLNVSSYNCPMSSNTLSGKWKSLIYFATVFSISVNRRLKCRNPDPKQAALAREVMRSNRISKRRKNITSFSKMAGVEAGEERSKRLNHTTLCSDAPHPTMPK